MRIVGEQEVIQKGGLKKGTHREDVEKIDPQILNDRGLFEIFQFGLWFDERNLDEGQDTVGFAQMSACN